MHKNRQYEMIQTMPGLAGHIASEVYDCQFRKQPLLAIQAGLCLMSVLKAQMFQGPTGLGCNIYTVGTAGPGKGKDRGLEFVTDTLDKLKLTELYNAGVGSPVGFIEGLKTGVCNSLLIWDEFGKDMTEILNTRSSASYLKAIANELMKLYSRSKGVYMPQVISSQSGRGNYRFYKPNVSVMGATVPEALFSSIKEMHIMDGLLPRFIYFKGLEDPKKVHYPSRWEVSDQLFDKLQNLANGTLLKRTIFGNEFTSQAGDTVHIGEKVDMHRVEMSQEAFKEYEFYAEKTHEAADNTKGFPRYLYGRLIENMLKVAVLVDDNETISKHSIEWAYELASECLVDFIGDIDRNTAETFFQRNVNKAKKLFIEHGELTPGYFANFMKLELKRAQDILEFLIAVGFIRVEYNQEKQKFYKVARGLCKTN